MINAPGEAYKLYIETYGCQMNVNDSEVVISILQNEHFSITRNITDADLILINTCSIRENAETRIKGRLQVFQQAKKKNPALIIGVIGCMAERLKEFLFTDNTVNLVVGPDAYRSLPQMIDNARNKQNAMNVQLAMEETYENIIPARTDKNGVSAFISITRGCNNYCSYCIVPYTRGKERSRNITSIVNEAKDLIERGYKEITLLGQNVNSYRWEEKGKHTDFSDLTAIIAALSSRVRIRFATSHPKDLSDKLIQTIAGHHNICNAIHLPVQSGSSSVLQRMKRKYTQESYLERINTIREIIPDCAISTDVISGFCGETDEEHRDTLSLMQTVQFDHAFMFKYSERPGTEAAKNLKDDVPEQIKTARLNEIIKQQNKASEDSNKKELGTIQEVLIEGVSKRSEDKLFGRTQYNKAVVFPKKDFKAGDYAMVRISGYTSATLLGEAVNCTETTSSLHQQSCNTSLRQQ